MTTAFGVSVLISYRYAPPNPNAPPIHIMPGVPRFILPDFSVRISPSAPYIMIEPKVMPHIIHEITRFPISLMSARLLFCFFTEYQAITNEEFAADDEEQHNADEYVACTDRQRGIGVAELCRTLFKEYNEH